ncbi:MAG: hypothetical protein K2X08_06955, partial [Chlamydiales bacterium]|nr:hypothetical protein [Chlamydiales bacterium]
MKLALVSLDWDAIDLIESLPELDLMGIIDICPKRCYDVAYLGSDDCWGVLKKTFPDLKVVLAIDLPSLKAR